ncbi:phage terminase small subunit [Salinicola sp. LHM]|uniref:phage terminase small subunit n=1 Tax=Salinicola sp. LHM TaxID=3065298 RepID=UPI002ACE19FC|nr:phage terminase small subunit [Salinicola sp. LHM]WQH33380.1 phage terminase small subunit [Salinicola sp. LHM]
MISPARQHFQRVTAAKAAGGATPGQPQNGPQYELMMAALYDARRALKQIKSTEGKIAKKSELLPQFDSYVEGVLEAGNGAQDEVLTTVLIWRFDIGDLAGALDIAGYALEHKLDMPDRFERDLESIVAEQLAEEVLAQLGKLDDDADQAERQALGTHLASLMVRARELLDGADMHDQISAKFHKAYGYALRDADCPSAAIEQLKRALELNDRAGVKRDIETLERQIKKNASNQSSPQGHG